MSRPSKPAPPPLAPGDTIDIVAPGFRCPVENLERGLEFLRQAGLRPRVPADLFGPDLLCSNSDAQRFTQLRRALMARDSRAVWCVRGGYGAIRLIQRLRACAVPRTPKLFVGYSDATTLHWLLNQHWRWPSLHGPLLDRLGSAQYPDSQRQELLDTLFGAQSQVCFANLTPLNPAARRRRTLDSRVFGGNLTVLQSMLGTPLQRTPKGILFLEDVGERGYRIDRMLEHMSQAGLLKRLDAIVFGSFIGGNETDGANLGPQVLNRFAQNQSIPVFSGVQAGHGEHQRPLFLRAAAQLVCGATPSLTITTPGFHRK